MNWRRYFLYLWKAKNRQMAARLGGNPEEPTSSYLGRIKKFHPWVQWLCRGLDSLFDQQLHCVNAIDPIDKNSSDPTGRYALVLLIGWAAFDLFALYCTAVVVTGWM